MPFDCEPSEIALRLVIRPIVENYFGGRCIRFRDRVGGDWRRGLRAEMLDSHFVVFDLSFNNSNVQRELDYFDTLSAASLSGRFAAYVAYRFESLTTPPSTLGETFRPADDSIDCVLYECTDQDLTNLASKLVFTMERSLTALGFEEVAGRWIRDSSVHEMTNGRDREDWLERLRPPV
jgi:hypothetical protein